MARTHRDRPLVAGIFVGGRGSRMGGQAKGLLVAPGGETIVARWRRMFDAVAVPAVLVGAHAAYAGVGLPLLEDAARGIGPLGGLLALLAHAGDGEAIAVACDMPYVSEALVRRLVEAPDAAAVAPRRAGKWEPLFARYDAPVARAVAVANAQAGRASLQALLDALGADELALTDAEAFELGDWDTPEDVARG